MGLNKAVRLNKTVQEQPHPFLGTDFDLLPRLVLRAGKAVPARRTIPRPPGCHCA